MMDKNIDKLFKNTFEQAQFNDADQHWGNVSAHLDGEQKRRKGLLWINWPYMAIIVVTALSFGIYWNTTSSEAVDVPNNSSEINNPTIEDNVKNKAHSLALNNIVLTEKNDNNIIRNENKIALQKNAIISPFNKPLPLVSNISNKDELKTRKELKSISNLNLDKVLNPLTHVKINTLQSSYKTPLNFPTVYDISSTKKIKVKSYKKWESFQIISLLLAPKGASTSAYTGIRYGWGIERYLHPNVFISSSLAIVYQRSNNGFNSVISQPSYGLKKTTSHYGIETKHLQYAHVPLLIGYKHQQHKIMLGAGLNIYLGAFGKISQIDPEAGQSIKEIGKGWISSNYAKKYIPELTGYYSYKMKRFNVGLSAHYYLDSFYPTPTIGNINPINDWSIGFNLIYPLVSVY